LRPTSAICGTIGTADSRGIRGTLAGDRYSRYTRHVAREHGRASSRTIGKG